MAPRRTGDGGGQRGANEQVNQARRPAGTQLSIEQKLNDMFMAVPPVEGRISINDPMQYHKTGDNRWVALPRTAEGRANMMPFEREPAQLAARQYAANRMAYDQHLGRKNNDSIINSGFPYPNAAALGDALNAFEPRDAARMEQGGRESLRGTGRATPEQQRSLLMRLLFGGSDLGE